MIHHARPAAGPLRGEVRVPGDKSISHRAVLFSAMSDGSCRLAGVLDSADVGATIRAEVEVVKVEPRSVSFSLTVLDDEDVISLGTHTRAVISRSRFDEKVDAKRERLGL